MKNFPALPYLYHKLFKSFSYSVDRWIELEKDNATQKKRTTHSDFIITRECDNQKKSMMTWAATQKVMVKLELFYSTKGTQGIERCIVIKYGEKKTLTPKELYAFLPASSGTRKIKKQVYIMVRELLEENFIC